MISWRSSTIRMPLILLTGRSVLTQKRGLQLNSRNSFLSKDHFGLILNEPAGRVAQVIVENAVRLVVSAWDNTSMDTRGVTENILECLFHPAFPDQTSQIQKAMTEEFRKWFQEQGCKSLHLLLMQMLIARSSQPARNFESPICRLCQSQQEQAYRRQLHHYGPFPWRAARWRLASRPSSASSARSWSAVFEYSTRLDVRQIAWPARIRYRRSTCMARRTSRCPSR